MYILPPIYDPSGMYAYVSSLSLSPDRAAQFLRSNRASSKSPVDSYILWIEKNSYYEKVGNVTVDVRIQAFTSNYSTWKNMAPSVRDAEWRWRRNAFSFNLSVEGPKRGHVQTNKTEV